jgi:hypothetical protein
LVVGKKPLAKKKKTCTYDAVQFCAVLDIRIGVKNLNGKDILLSAIEAPEYKDPPPNGECSAMAAGIVQWRQITIKQGQCTDTSSFTGRSSVMNAQTRKCSLR